MTAHGALIVMLAIVSGCLFLIVWGINALVNRRAQVRASENKRLRAEAAVYAKLFDDIRGVALLFADTESALAFGIRQRMATATEQLTEIRREQPARHRLDTFTY